MLFDGSEIRTLDMEITKNKAFPTESVTKKNSNSPKQNMHCLSKILAQFKLQQSDRSRNQFMSSTTPFLVIYKTSDQLMKEKFDKLCDLCLSFVKLLSISENQQ